LVRIFTLRPTEKKLADLKNLQAFFGVAKMDLGHIRNHVIYIKRSAQEILQLALQ
jgi:hypothetical protein